MQSLKWLPKSKTIGISYLRGDELAVVFLERHGDHFKVLETLSVFTTLLDASAQELQARFRSRLAFFQSRSPLWIHLVMRSVAFVKVFPQSRVSGGDQSAEIEKRIQTEIPYLADEVILHKIFQPSEDEELMQVLVLGVSKNVLSEQMKKLEAYGIVPARVLLTTDVLNWLFHSQLFSKEKPESSALLIHLFSDQVEILFFEESQLLQSRWVQKGREPATGVREAIQASLTGFQREWRRKPNLVLVLGAVSQSEADSLISDSSLRVERISFGDDSPAVPPLLQAVIKACEAGTVFDFSLGQTKEVRRKESRVREQSRLTIAGLAFMFSLLALAAVQLASSFVQIGWFRFRMGLLAESVGQLKQMRAEALSVQDFQEKKSAPVLLLAAVRRAIPDPILLRELQFDEKKASIKLKGAASDQPQIDQFINALEKESVTSNLVLEGVQTERDEAGTVAYQFSIKGSLKMGERK